MGTPRGCPNTLALRLPPPPTARSRLPLDAAGIARETVIKLRVCSRGLGRVGLDKAVVLASEGDRQGLRTGGTWRASGASSGLFMSWCHVPSQHLGVPDTTGHETSKGSSESCTTKYFIEDNQVFILAQKHPPLLSLSYTHALHQPTNQPTNLCTVPSLPAPV